MGIDYHPKNKKLGQLNDDMIGSDFVVNYSGAAILGYCHSRVGLPVIGHHEFRVPYSATKSEVLLYANALEEISGDYLIQEFARMEDAGYIDGSPDRLRDFLENWKAFLRNCGGYEAD